jgi:hypothetical protein
MGIPGPGPPLKAQPKPRPKPCQPPLPPDDESPPVQLTLHLYERTEVENSFQLSAMSGDVFDSVYWLLELCESGWVDRAWDQLWLAYYDFYAAHNPQFEGELMQLMQLRRKNGTRSRYPLLHGASALIGRSRSIGAWLLRQGALLRATPTVPEEVDWDEQPLRMINDPVEAAVVLGTVARAGWQDATPLYSALVQAASDGEEGGEGGACGAWGKAGSSPLAVLCALLLHLELAWTGLEERGSLDLSPIEADREMVRGAVELVRRTRITKPRDRLLLWRQAPMHVALGCFDLPRSKLSRGQLIEFVQSDWLRGTMGCPAWDKAIERCGGVREGNGRVNWATEEGEERFSRLYDPDVDELPDSVIADGARPVYSRKKLWGLRKVWPKKEVPDLWKTLLQE